MTPQAELSMRAGLPAIKGRTARHPNLLGSIAGALSKMLGVQKERRHLSELSDCMLDDIGLTREQALRESKRPAWDHARRRTRNHR